MAVGKTFWWIVILRYVALVSRYPFSSHSPCFWQKIASFSEIFNNLCASLSDCIAVKNLLPTKIYSSPIKLANKGNISKFKVSAEAF